MIRSIDLMFALPEFRLFLNQIEGFQAAPFYHLLRINGNPSVPKLDTSIRNKLSDLVSEVSNEELRLDFGKLLFLTFLDGSGFIAQKLLSACDEDFVVTFVAGALSTESDERRVKLPSVSERLYYGIYNYFDKVIKTLAENREEPNENKNNRREILLSTNDFVTSSITNPDRLFDLSLYDSFVERQGSSKSWVTKHVIDGYQQYKRITEIVDAIDQGEKKEYPKFGVLEGYGLLLGLNCSLTFELAQVRTSAMLSLPFFLDLLYGYNQLLTKEECFSIWLERNGIKAGHVKNISAYPYGLNISYSQDVELTDHEATNHLVSYLSNRFGLIYDVAIVFMKLLFYNTNFNLTKYGDLGPWKNTSRLVVTESTLAILPIMDAINEKMEIFNDLDFRSPIVPWDSQMSFLGPNAAWPKYFLNKVNNVLPAAKELIRDVFFDQIALSIEGFYGYQLDEKIFILRSQQEMLNKLESLSDSDKIALENVDFSAYLSSLGFPETDLPMEEYKGVNGLEKSVLHHSLVHLRLGVKNEFTWPMYIPPILE